MLRLAPHTEIAGPVQLLEAVTQNSQRMKRREPSVWWNKRSPHETETNVRQVFVGERRTGTRRSVRRHSIAEVA